LRARLIGITEHEVATARGTAATLRAVESLRQLDAHEEVSETGTRQEKPSETDPWWLVDLWDRLAVARGWEPRGLTSHEEHQLGRDWERITQASDPSLALDRYRAAHARGSIVAAVPRHER
jgi:hypothetical protein